MLGLGLLVNPQKGTRMETLVGRVLWFSKRPSCKRVPTVFPVHSSRG